MPHRFRFIMNNFVSGTREIHALAYTQLVIVHWMCNALGAAAFFAIHSPHARSRVMYYIFIFFRYKFFFFRVAVCRCHRRRRRRSVLCLPS